MSNNIWTDLHEHYKNTDWIDKPSLFAQTAISYFPKSGLVLELGAGQGQDSRFFAEHGYTVTCTDIEQSALDIAKTKSGEASIDFQQVDLSRELPFKDESYDVIYAHLSLHYFDNETTKRLFYEVMRILKPGGTFAFFTNSTSDPEYGTGTKLEADYFQIDGTAKRYLTVDTARSYARFFETTLLDNHGETYKDAAKGVHNLIRFIGQKPLKLNNYSMAIPFCGAIIERTTNGQTEVLMQTRWQPGYDTVYSGTLEFPAGKLDQPYELVHDTIAREIKEETGLTLKMIKNDDRTEVMTTGKDDKIIGFKPFCCVQQLSNGKPWIGFIFVCEVEPGEPVSQVSEAKDGHWMPIEELRTLYEATPERLFGLELPAWHYYFNN